ncbi:DUF4145 domain-containing protein [Kordia sp. YSTF-M3]|uniref:DUF4145 domain-containing protein n=1 Tax=Kordia aestuariivivens TaxID=2759037 RepID=A0ABR7Q877_9FLAO|nr:DUF4145 domain-containing protein [Kordia aestuariivivens]MBC8754755.1 DUF4145 domain-containing protein [Kordia aestuariivivens]
MYQVNTNAGATKIDKLPEKCPFCHSVISPRPINGNSGNDRMEIFMSCPKSTCKNSFIGYYKYENNMWRYANETTIGNLTAKDFSDSIQEVSPSFVKIYNEAYSAEQQNLKEICGVGYRKALEFLIKDYVILSNKEEEDKILKMRLGNCIKDLVTDDRVKSVAKRAVWLGNDETHYVRKWETKNLEDLKKLISLTVHWIEMEKLTESFETEMPE